MAHTTNIIAAGSRRFDDCGSLENIIDIFLEKYEDIAFAHRGAKGSNEILP